jgi:sensor histidine kinase YesM
MSERNRWFLVSVLGVWLQLAAYAHGSSLPAGDGMLTVAGGDSARVALNYDKAVLLLNSDPKEAMRLLDEAERISMGTDQKYRIGNIFSLKGNLFRAAQDHISALKYFRSASFWYYKERDSVSLAGIYINIARLCYEAGDTAGDERYLRLAHQICPESSLEALSVKSTVLLNFGVLYFRRKNYRKALPYIQQSLAMQRQIGSTQRIALAYNNLAMISSTLDEDEKAARYADSALAEALGKKDSYQLSIVYSTKADLLMKQQKYAEAISFYELSLKQSRDLSYSGYITYELYKELYNCYNNLHDYRNALKYHELYMQCKDSVTGIERVKQFTEIESRYKLEQKNATILHLNRQNQLQGKLTNRQNIIIVVSVSTLVLSVMLMLLFIGYNTKIRKLNTLLRTKTHRITEQNRYIQAQKALLQKEASKLENENTIAHFEILKTQVNPHMLFNALAVLKTVILKDKKDACGFVDDLANVFRQALHLKADLLVKLREELSFVESYINVITKQYENCFHVEIDIPEEIREYYIPPFSLQMIVENVIKHNEFCEQIPLFLKISYKDQEIHVDNTVTRRKMMEAFSSGIGHRNLINRYKLVSEKEPQFISEDTFFSARLPVFIDE